MGARAWLVAVALAVSAAVPASAATGSSVVAISPTDTPARILAEAAAVTPTDRQLAWQREELTGFVHFGPNTYTGNEVGTGTESPDLIQPTDLDTDQWAASFRDAGFQKVILVAKHHDGMLMFPSAYSSYGVAASSWLNGTGDLVKAFTDSAHKYGIKVGLYLSPADLHEAQPGGRFGNGSPKVTSTIPSDPGAGPTFTFQADDYNRYYENTLYELLTRYGTIDEVWFDGYDPTGGKQPYSTRDWYQLVRALQPTAVTFGGDVRWVGNENGIARTSEWSVIPNTGTADPDGTRSSTYGETADDIAQDDKLTTASNYLAWFPAECDARLESTWFWHPDQPPKTLDALMATYYSSVGRNCQLLLDVPPDQTGRFDSADTARLAEFGQAVRAAFATDLAAGATAGNDTGTTSSTGNDPANTVDGDDTTAWQPTGLTGGLVLDLGGPKTFDVLRVRENLQVGQRVEGFALDTWTGTGWQQATTGTTVGHQRLLQLASPVTTSKVRLRITGSRALPPAIATIGLFNDGRGVDLALNKPASQSSTANNAPAARAVDGVTNGDFFAGSVTHTNADPNAWWQVDLGASTPIGSVAVWNRTDCCASRLTDYWVFVSDHPFTTGLTPGQQAAQPGVWSNHQTGQAGTPTTLTVGATGRYLMVQLSGTNYLSLAEVQVFAPTDDFSIAASQPMSSVPAGSAATSTVTTSVTLGTAQPVALSVSGLPAGATATLDPTGVTAGGSATLTVQTGAATPPGDYLVTVTGQSAQARHTAQLTLSVIAAAPPAPGHRYLITDPALGTSVDDPASSTTAGTQLITWTTHGGGNQQWALTRNPDGTWTFGNAVSGLCADVSGGSTSSGAAVIQWTCTGNGNQHWRLTPVTGGYRITSASSGLALTAGGAGDGPGLVQATDTGATTQLWTFGLVA